MFYSLRDFPKTLRGKHPLLGMDIGTKTLGLSLSDLTWCVATPLFTINRSQYKKDLALLLEVVVEHNPAGIIVGWPLNMDGTEGARCQATRDITKLMQQDIQLPFAFQDERLSTVAVTNVMLEANLSRKKRAENVDKLAAAYILQGALDVMGRNYLS